MNISTVHSVEKSTTQRVISKDDTHANKKKKPKKIDPPKDNSYTTTQKVAIVAGAVVLGTVCIGGLLYFSGVALFGGGATVAVGTSSAGGGAAVLTTGGATVTKGALATKALLAAQAAAAGSAKAAAATKAAAAFAAGSSAASTALTIGGVEAGKAAFISASLSSIFNAAPVAVAATNMKVAGALGISGTKLATTAVGAVAIMESAKVAIASTGSTKAGATALTTKIISSLPSAKQAAAAVVSSVDMTATSQLAVGTSALTITEVLSKVKLAGVAENAIAKISQSYQQSEILAKLNGYQAPTPDQLRINFMNKLTGISETSPNSSSRAMLLTLCGALGTKAALPQNSAVPQGRVIESDISIQKVPEQEVVSSEQEVISNQQPINFKNGMIYPQINERVLNEAFKTASLRTRKEILLAALEKYPRTDFSFIGLYHGFWRHFEFGADPATRGGETSIKCLKVAPTIVGIATIAAATMGTSIPFIVPALTAGISCELHLHDRQYSQAALALLSAAPGCGTHFKAILNGEGGLGRLAIFNLTRIAKIGSAGYTLSGGPGSTFISRAEYTGAFCDVITESQPHRW